MELKALQLMCAEKCHNTDKHFTMFNKIVYDLHMAGTSLGTFGHTDPVLQGCIRDLHLLGEYIKHLEVIKMHDESCINNKETLAKWLAKLTIKLFAYCEDNQINLESCIRDIVEE